MDINELTIKILTAIVAVAGAIGAYIRWRQSKVNSNNGKARICAEGDKSRTVKINAGRDSTYIADSFNQGKKEDGN